VIALISCKFPPGFTYKLQALSPGEDSVSKPHSVSCPICEDVYYFDTW